MVKKNFNSLLKCIHHKCIQPFFQAVSMFSNALQSGQLGPVVSQFDVNSEAVTAANKGDVEEFVKALEGKPSKIEKKDAEENVVPPEKQEKEDSKMDSVD